jgi:ribonuclease BN (tRNA processing enzyme)
MPLDALMPDAGALVRATDVTVPTRAAGADLIPTVVFQDEILKVTAIRVTHGHAVPAYAYRFDTPDGAVVFSGDTTVNDDLVTFAEDAGILVHSVADLGYLERHGFVGDALKRMAMLHTDISEVGGVAERARVGELVLTHYLPAEPDAITDAEWARRAGIGFRGTTTAGHDGLRRTLSH